MKTKVLYVVMSIYLISHIPARLRMIFLKWSGGPTRLLLIIIILLAGGSHPTFCFSQTPGETIFKTSCSACHTIGKGKLVGPDLAGVYKKYTEAWLIKWIRSSQTLVKANDAKAVALFNQWNKIPMPDNNLSDVQIKSVIAYMKKMTPPPHASTTSVKTITAAKTVTTAPPKPKPAVQQIWVPSEISIKSLKVSGEIDAKDLSNLNWQNTHQVSIPLFAQNVVNPMLQKQSISDLKVRSLHTENTVAFLIEWIDSTKNVIVDVDKFCDQIAVQLPVNFDSVPSYMMGNNSGRVHIVHWKGVWQEDCENGFRDVKDAYPNYWVDIYPLQEHELDRSKKMFANDITADQIIETESRNYLAGTYSGNPMSTIKRKVPVEEASAEGFGSLTTQQTQSATAWANWKDNKWTVCIVVPINTGNIFKARIKDKTKIAFAVWNGNLSNVGGRKQYAPWADLILEQ